jgi:peptidoglycan biosynthesis protein MviN/MurJ (putative lipid II flippase)
LWAMRGRIHGVHGRELLTSTLKVLAASALMGAACYASSHLMREHLGLGKLARLTDLMVSIPLGLAVFYATARALKIAELEMAVKAVAGPLRRFLGNSRAKMD